jgi:rsbT antagonist protein RsbS
MTEDSGYKRAYERQKAAREKAEQRLETRSRELYESHAILSKANKDLRTQKEIAESATSAKLELLATMLRTSVADSTESISIAMYETQGCLVVPIQEELSKHAAHQIQRKILKRIPASSLEGVVIDLTAVAVIDSILWDVFLKTTQMIKMLGYRSVITGLNPGVVASIIYLDLDIDNVTTALQLEDALSFLSKASDLEITEANSAESLEIEDIHEAGAEKGMNSDPA